MKRFLCLILSILILTGCTTLPESDLPPLEEKLPSGPIEISSVQDIIDLTDEQLRAIYWGDIKVVISDFPIIIDSVAAEIAYSNIQHITCTDTNRFISRITALDKESVLLIMDSASISAQNMIYREFKETDTEFIYTGYWLERFDNGFFEYFVRVQERPVVICKSTGEFERQFLYPNPPNWVTIREALRSLPPVAPEPGREIVPLTPELEERVRNDWNEHRGWDKAFDSVDYLGTYNGIVVFTAHEGGITAVREERIGGFVFSYYDAGHRVWVWNDGEIHPLVTYTIYYTPVHGAYDLGLLTKQDVSDILYYFHQSHPWFGGRES
jgi:hypothetical protein